jgi:8-amino-7-oxononanoate synthase
MAAASRKAVEMVTGSFGDQQRAKLRRIIERFKMVVLTESNSAIQPVLVSDDRKALNLSKQLLEMGMLVQAIRPPTVPEGTARLRIALSADHEPNNIDKILGFTWNAT